MQFQLCVTRFQALAEDLSHLHSSLFDSDTATLSHISLYPLTSYTCQTSFKLVVASLTSSQIEAVLSADGEHHIFTGSVQKTSRQV